MSKTSVTAVVKDPSGNIYANATVIASFVGQNTTPGSGPYLDGGLPQGLFQLIVPTETDSAGNLALNLTDNNTITPTPSQWNFTVLSDTTPMVSFSVLITITGTNQDITAALQAASATLLPIPGGTLSVGLNPNADGTLSLGNATNRWNASLYTVTARTLENIRFADQFATGGAGTSGNPWTSASGTGGIQEAINDITSSGTVYLSAGYYSITATISIGNRNITMRGDSQQASVLLVAASVGATTDVISFAPTASSIAILKFSDFKIIAASGTPARHAFNLDGTSGGMVNSVFDHLDIEALGGKAINASGSGVGNGMPATSIIQNSVLVNGIAMTTAGDTVRILNNTFSGANAALDITSTSGSSTLIFAGNNVTSNGGGIHFGSNIVAAYVVNNEFETGASFTGSNSSVVDIDAVTGSHAKEVTIYGNSFQVVNGITANGIRVNFADRTNIFGNRFGRGATTSKDILITANATDTMVGTNEWASGTPITSMISDSGVTTSLLFQFSGQTLANATNSPTLPAYGFSGSPASGLDANSGLPYMSASGAADSFWTTTEQRNGSAIPYAWSSNADPRNAGADTGLSRVAAAVVGIGNGTQGNTSGELRSAKIAATYNLTGTLQTAVHIVQDTVTLSAGGTATVTLSGSAVFTSGTSYSCVAVDDTGAAAVQVTQTSGSSITFTGTANHVVRFICIGA